MDTSWENGNRARAEIEWIGWTNGQLEEGPRVNTWNIYY